MELIKGSVSRDFRPMYILQRENGIQGVQAGDPHGVQHPAQARLHLPLHLHILGHPPSLGNTGGPGTGGQVAGGAGRAGSRWGM